MHFHRLRSILLGRHLVLHDYLRGCRLDPVYVERSAEATHCQPERYSLVRTLVTVEMRCYRMICEVAEKGTPVDGKLLSGSAMGLLTMTVVRYAVKWNP